MLIKNKMGDATSSVVTSKVADVMAILCTAADVRSQMQGAQHIHPIMLFLLYRVLKFSMFALSIISISSDLPICLEPTGVLKDNCFWSREALLPPEGFAVVIRFRP